MANMSMLAYLHNTNMFKDETYMFTYRTGTLTYMCVLLPCKQVSTARNINTTYAFMKISVHA